MSVVAIVLAIAMVAIYLVVLNAIDRYEKEPTSILIACVLLGAIVAPFIVAAIFAVMGRGFDLPLDFVAGGATDAWTGIVEESVSGVLLLILVFLIRDEFDDVLDGIVYGAALGAGFGAAESIWFAIGGTGLLTTESIVALLVSAFNHAFYGAVFGAIVGYARWHGSTTRKWAIIVLGLATAALLHAFHDTLPTIMARVLGRPEDAVAGLSRAIALTIDLLGLVTIFVAVILYWRREAQVLREQLRDEVATGVVTQPDYDTITSARRSIGRQMAALRSRGWRGFVSLHRLYATEAELAFVKRRLEIHRRRRPDESRVDELRTQIGQLRESVEGGAAR